MKIVVIGAGVLGACVARSLAVAGEDVLLLDQCGPGTGTTATTFSWTNANGKLDPDYHLLNVEGIEEHARLAQQLPGLRSYSPSGSLHFADSASQSWLASRVHKLRSLNYPARFIEREEARRLAGDIRIPASVTSIALFPSEGYVLPDRLVQGLVSDARRYGASISLGEVVAIDEGANGVSVTLAGGGVCTGDRVVLAAGRGTEKLAARAGIELPMVTDIHRGSPTIGLLGYVRSPKVDLRCVIHTPVLNLRPGANGHNVVQALDLNDSVDPLSPPSADSEIASRIAKRFTALITLTDPARAPEIELRVGLRSLPADGRPLAGYASAHSRIYCLVSHSGITLGPLLGRLVATEIITDQAQDLLRAFRPGRLAGIDRTDIKLEDSAQLGEQRSRRQRPNPVTEGSPK